MIDKMNQKINRVNKKLGVEVTLPKMTKSRLRASSLTNFVVGSGLVVIGIGTGMTGTLILGGLGIASSVVMGNEAKKKAHK